MERRSGGCSGSGEVSWGKAFEWEIKGASEEEVWGVTGEFVRVDKWVTTLVKSCELMAGEAQKAGCVRKPLLYPAAPGEPFTFAFEELLEMDELHHHYSYTILPGSTLPGFSLMKDYVSTFKLSPLPPARRVSPPPAHEHDNNKFEEKGTLLRWSFVCCPVSALSQEETHTIAFSLYTVAINDLKTRLSLPNDSIILI